MKYLTIILALPLFLLSACQQTDLDPGTNVEGKKNGAFVDVNGRRSNIFFGGDGIRVDTPKSRINIRGAGSQASD